MFVHLAISSAGRGAVNTACRLITAVSPRHSSLRKTSVTCPACLRALKAVKHA